MEELPERSLSRLSFAGISSGISSIASNTSVMSQAMVSQRIVNVEYYMAPPVKEFDNLYSEFRSSGVKKVPVLRIFGSTSAGQKMCANIHGVYPYISILDDESVEGFEYRIATALDNAINDTVNTNKYFKGNESHKTGTAQHVFNVIRVVGKTFYGYRSRNEMFLRIFFYNPMMLKKAVDLLQNASVLGRRFQVYEAHIPYTLQFMIDYCLYGMNYVHYAAVKFRKNSGDRRQKNSEELRSVSQGSNSSVPGHVDVDNVDEALLAPSNLSKMTSCELEVDVKACDIMLETKSSEKRMSKNPGIDCIWKDEIERRRQHGVDECSQITVPESQSRSQVQLVHTAEDKHLKTLGSKLESYFETHDVSLMEAEEYADTTLVESQLDDDKAEWIPSSQVLDHLSAEVKVKNGDDSENHLSQEEDDFLNLLEKMTSAPSSVDDQPGMSENPFGFDDDESDEICKLACEEEDAQEHDDNVWNCSQLELDSFLLDKISEAESSFSNSEVKGKYDPNKSDSSRVIFQCDGQGVNSDSSSDESSLNLRSRSSVSAIELKRGRSRLAKSANDPVRNAATPANKAVESIRKTRNSVSKSPVSSSRLSLTARRKSRSQEIGKMSSNVATPVASSGSTKSVRKSLLRRSRSMSSEKEISKNSVKASKIEERSKPTVEGSSSSTVSRHSTRRSTAATVTNIISPVSKSTGSLNLGSEKLSKTDFATVKASASTGKLNFPELFKKEPYIYIQKLNLDELPNQSELELKRPRRKPKRFIDDSDDGKGNTDDELKVKAKVSKVFSTENPTSSTASRSGCIRFPEVDVQKKKKKKKSSVDTKSNGDVEPTRKRDLEKQSVEETDHADNAKKLATNSQTTESTSVPQKIRKKNKKLILDAEPTKSTDKSSKPSSESTCTSKESLISGENASGVKSERKQDLYSSNNISTQVAECKVEYLSTSVHENIGKEEYNVPERVDTVNTLKQKGKKKVRKSDRGSSTVDSSVKTNTPVKQESQEPIWEEGTTPSCAAAQKTTSMETVADNQVDTGSIDKAKSPNVPRKKALGLRRLKVIIKPSVETPSLEIPVSSAKQGVEERCIGSATGSGKIMATSNSGSNEEVERKAKKVKKIPQPDGPSIDPTIKMKIGTKDVGLTCKADTVSFKTQTTLVVKKDVSVIAQPEMDDNSTQIGNISVSREIQTMEKRMISTETQTDAVVPMCMCQCTCVVKPKTDVGIEVQNDLKPVMENKRIQVDNSDLISRARSSRFATPQSNKIRRATPSKSPEKRRQIGESPARAMSGISHSGSRYLSALVLKTPTSHHKYRSINFSRSVTPKQAVDKEEEVIQKTPGSRESKERYLINSIRAASVSPKSPRKRSSHIKPRNLNSESRSSEVHIAKNSIATSADLTREEQVPKLELLENGNCQDPCIDNEDMLSSIDTEGNLEMQEDLSINSIYEYEDQSPQVLSNWPEPFNHINVKSSPSPSPFQTKRILSKHRTKNRLEKKRIANLDANRTIPDAFEIEYEPLKQPPCYKSTMKWLDASKHQGFPDNGSPSEKNKNFTDKDSSDEECLPPPIKLFGGGNMSDEDDSDVEHPRSGVANEAAVIKPFTPPLIDFCVNGDIQTPAIVSISKDKETPRSILRQSSGGTARRLSGQVLKRKIRWEDSDLVTDQRSKRVKLEAVINEGNEPNVSVILSNTSLNKTLDTSELDGPGIKNALGLENSMSNYQDVKALHQSQFLTTMCVEVHCASRCGLLPNPAFDPVLVIFVLISTDYPDGFNRPKESLTLLLLDEGRDILSGNDQNQTAKAYSNEADLFDAFASLVQLWDPDILVGYEIEKASFGYLIQRSLTLGKDLSTALSRVLPLPNKGDDKYAAFRAREEWNGSIGGRVVLNLWRLLRHEITVQSYTFENAAYHILLRRVCKFSQKTLSSYWSHKMHRHKVIQYYTVRVKGVIQIMEKLDLVNRTSELARLFGIQFYEVLSRGSQFRVESMMLRATKPLDFIAPSPNVLQRAKMRAPEYLPLIMEPQSNYYTDPVAVLDFQSLYPSMMIAYNYDYASLLGRVEHLGTTEHFPLGCLDHMVPPSDLLRLKEHIHVSPAGIAFLDKSVVKGVLPEMLEQILDTRQMVKRAMKKWKNEGASLQKVLDSRQLGLKLIANVTYGYTSANFSGRMPCVEVADSIVSKGRETLQRAINHVKDNFDRWGAEVVYGDTDSMFVLFKGKTKAEAFKLAYEIAEEVTQANPKPVKLKFEKIYQPCILQSKKRYVGYAYETPDQSKPTYDAKGIETVRRDGCPAVRKILEKTLHVLFTSNKPEKVEQYVKSQFEKLFKGRVSMQDYIFAKEFRGRSGYKPTASVPSLEIAKRLSEIDPRAEPLVSERVPYVVIYGNPTLPLIKLVRTPEEYLENPAMRLNAHYYIEKVIIPALNRCLIHAGINATKWYLQLPRKYLRNVLEQKSKGQGTLDDYILHQNCLRCDGKAEQGLCKKCLSDETASIIYLQEVVTKAKSKLNACVEICTNCAGESDRCVSIDCPVLHKLTRYQRDQAYMKNVERELVKLEW